VADALPCRGITGGSTAPMPGGRWRSDVGSSGAFSRPLSDRNLQRVGMKCICTAVRVLRLDALLKEACHVAPRKAHA